MQTQFWHKRRLLALAVGVVFSGCANIVSPEGGPKDVSPPAMVLADPPDRSLNFKEDQIHITFDEFIELKDISSQLFVSPPVNEAPEVRIKGKGMLIGLPDSLAENTTYTLYFGSAVRDITEGNILKDFTFSFSTGPTRDSLEMKGKLIDAYTGEPVEDLLVCVYKGGDDSLFSNRQPDYLTRSRKDGSFSVFNLPQDSFRVYALKDANANYYYDLPNEAIAFDTLWFRPDPPKLKADTLLPTDSSGTDSTLRLQGLLIRDSTLSMDTLIPDSVVAAWYPEKQAILRVFTDKDTTQRLLKSWAPGQGHIRLEFSQAMPDLRITPLDTVFNGIWALEAWCATRDTLDLWLLQPAGDSIALVLSDMQYFSDTARISLMERALSRKPSRQSAPQEASPVFRPSSNFNRSIFVSEQFTLLSPYPLDTVFAERLWLIGGGDTIQPHINITGDDRRKVVLKQALSPGLEYLLICGDSSLRDIRSYHNDSSAFRIRTLLPEDGGTLIFELSGMEHDRWTVELTGAKKEVIRKYRRQGNGEIIFPALLPGIYKLRLYEDSNLNGRWDSGFFPGRIQPETMVHYPSELNVRAKWELKEALDMAKHKGSGN